MQEQYFQIMDRVSNSSLSKINPKEGGSPVRYMAFLRNEKEPYEKKGSYFDLGTLAHNRVLEPEKYEMIVLPTPSDAIAEIIKKIFNMNIAALDWSGIVDTKLEDHEKDIHTFAKEINYGQSWKAETRLSKVLEWTSYYNALKESNTKMIADDIMIDKVHRMEAELKAKPNIMYLLYDIDEEPGVQTFNEQEVLWEEVIDGVTIKFKAKLDRLILKDGKFTIIDVKTTGKAIALFPEAIERYRYHRQTAFYRRAAREFLKQKFGKDFEFENAYITAVETSGFFESELFRIGDDLLQEGGQEIRDLLNRIVWHHQNNQWIEPMEAEGGFISVDSFE